MTIEEAIMHCEEVAGRCTANRCECAADHLQLKAWLQELVELRKRENVRSDLQGEYEAELIANKITADEKSKRSGNVSYDWGHLKHAALKGIKKALNE